MATLQDKVAQAERLIGRILERLHKETLKEGFTIDGIRTNTTYHLQHWRGKKHIDAAMIRAEITLRNKNS